MKMRKIMASAVIAVFLTGLACAGPANTNIAVWKVNSSGTPVTFVDGSGRIIAPGFVVDDVILTDSLTISTNLTVGGKSTLNGELEVNNSDVDINLTSSDDEVSIVQTNTVATEATPRIAITDAATGATATEADEATVVITSAGVYGLVVADGILQVEGTIDSQGDITLDPAGNDVIIDGTADANGYTSDAGDGLDVKSAGALKLGAATATSVDISKSTVVVTNKGPLVVDEAATFKDTVAAVGVLTCTATPVMKDSLTVQTNVDAKSFTSDAGQGLDVQAAGALKLGAGTATSVDISKSTVVVTNKGPLVVDEAGTFKSTLDVTGVGTFTATPVCKDSLTVQTNVDAKSFTSDPGQGIDVQAAGALEIGVATATSLDIGRTAIVTTNKGPFVVDEAGTFKSTLDVTGIGTFTATPLCKDSLTVQTNVDAKAFTSDPGQGLDVQASGALKLGAATATSVDISKSTVVVTNKGPLVVDEAATFKSTMDVTGVGTFTATPVCKDSLTVQTNVDAASFTSDAGAGLDTQAAGALKLGAATATSIDIGDTAVQVTNKGPLTVNEAFIAQTTGQIVGNTVLGASLNVAGAVTFSNTLACQGTNFHDKADKTSVFGAPEITIGALASAQLISTNIITMKDANGTTKTGYALARVYMSETQYGAVTTNNTEALSLTGTQVQEVVANGDYWQVTVAGGTITATVTATACLTNFLNVSVGGAVVTSTAIPLVP